LGAEVGVLPPVRFGCRIAVDTVHAIGANLNEGGVGVLGHGVLLLGLVLRRRANGRCLAGEGIAVLMGDPLVLLRVRRWRTAPRSTPRRRLRGTCDGRR